MALLLVAAGCASYDPPCPVLPAGDPGPLDAVVFVVGDAGGPVQASLQVIEPLRAEVVRAVRELGGDRTVVVFAGDNVYPAGLPAEGHPYRAEAERRLDAQLALAETGAVVRLVPGNHDWNHWRRGGIAAVAEQTEYVARASGDVRVVPGNGCPGPVRLDAGERLRLLFLDTQFWLHTAEPVEPNACRPGTKGAALAELRAEVETPRQVVVVGHHPLRSGGPHGGWFGWRTWLFPPVPLARLLGITTQDLRARRYRETVRAFCDATARDNVLWAAGHEHNLQLFERDERCPASLVSGNGMADHASPLRVLPRTRACSTAPGWARIDIPRQGAPRVSLHRADRAPLHQRGGPLDAPAATPVLLTSDAFFGDRFIFDPASRWLVSTGDRSSMSEIPRNPHTFRCWPLKRPDLLHYSDRRAGMIRRDEWATLFPTVPYPDRKAQATNVLTARHPSASARSARTF